jgi:hypothetical protein
MIYKHRSKVGHLPRWQSLATHIVFVICAVSGSWYLLAHEFQITTIAVENHSILMAHGIAAYFLVLLFGAVIPTHIKAAWKSKRNRISGGFMMKLERLLYGRIGLLAVYYWFYSRFILLLVVGLIILRLSATSINNPSHFNQPKLTCAINTVDT